MTSIVIPIRQSAVEQSIKRAAFDQLPLASLCIGAAGQVLAANDAARSSRSGFRVSSIVPHRSPRPDTIN
jgi:hypothetical protein